MEQAIEKGSGFVYIYACANMLYLRIEESDDKLARENNLIEK